MPALIKSGQERGDGRQEGAEEQEDKYGTGASGQAALLHGAVVPPGGEELIRQGRVWVDGVPARRPGGEV